MRNVPIVEAAVAECDGMGRFTTNQSLCGNALTLEDAALLVPTVTLDTLNIPPPDFIRMDIEGGESGALPG